ncbi:uncharacterized protein LOC118756443 [Rhagoletis pomonella]|uniref:uncharacterized protein LOC118756443 n=1 Tax=Rhagoletis pomonella TaxID=28610 RepID=UPI00177FB61B|nr:uncharacterized protein LOC118756443 [Rhagoletis pomonella]
MSKVKVRDSALNAIKRYVVISKNDALALDKEAVETYLQLLEEQWVRFADAQQEVELLCGEESAPVEEQSRTQAEEWYITAKANFKRLIGSPEQPRPSTSTSFTSSPVQLPKLQLPTFSGDPTNWLAFFDAFQSLVHTNASLSASQKLHYLRNCLQGEALQLVSSLQICDGNYNAAWDLLTTRYKVLRVMVDGHFKAIFAIEKASRDTGKAIKQVLNATMQHVGSLRALGRPVEFWDDWLVHLTVSKLAYETRKQWELSLVRDVLPTFEELVEFLETRARSLEMVSTSGALSTSAQGARQLSKTAAKTTTNVLHAIGEQHTSSSNLVDAGASSPSCFHCNAKHKIYACPTFRKLNAAARFALVKKHNVCLNCLSKGHFQAKCRSLSTCNICRRRHHTLLHGCREDDTTSDELNVHASPFVKQQGNLLVQQSTTSSTIDDSTTARIHNASSDVPHSGCVASHVAEADKAILLATAEIYLQDHAGRWQPARVLFDNGSHASFVTEACIQRLRLQRKPSAAHVTGIGSTDGGKVKGETILSLAPRSLDQHFTINSLILSKITNDLPSVCVQMSSWPHLRNLALADQHYAKPGPIDVLIGMDEMDKFLLTGLCKGPPDTPMAQNTVFGWVLFGKAMRSSSPSAGVLSLHCDEQLIRMVSKFWELEEFPPKRYLTVEEEACEGHFRKHCRRAEDGRYIVRLPLKESVPLGESRNISVRSLLRMEKRFAVDEELRRQYAEFMQELLNMGHMELVGNAQPHKSYYMPHHAVVKNTSSTTKLRVVFYASCKTTSGFSLNDALMIGPQLQEDLFSIMVRFRTHRYAIMADVEKMYRQVYVAEQDVDYQRIVWRDDPTEPIRDYRMLRVTYGVAAASHLAVRSLHQSALDAIETHKEATVVIMRDFYMDDLLTGSFSVDNLMKLRNDVTIVLSNAGFELRKWATNCDELREKIPHASKQISHLLADGDEVRTLGIIWNTSDDCLSIAVNLTPLPAILTKRVFLSDSSKVFDPLGLIAPCTILSKIWLQRIWRADVDWDEPVPADVAEGWLSHRQQLPKLTALKLNRWIGTSEIVEHAEYHVFTDASQRAYAAVLYCRTQLPDGTFKRI